MEKTKTSLVIQLLNKVFTVSKQGLKLIFSWVPSHARIPGNEHADQAASTCSIRTVDIHGILFTDLKAALKACIKDKWQNEWNSQENDKLQVIKSSLREWKSAQHREPVVPLTQVIKNMNILHLA